MLFIVSKRVIKKTTDIIFTWELKWFTKVSKHADRLVSKSLLLFQTFTKKRNIALISGSSLIFKMNQICKSSYLNNLPRIVWPPRPCSWGKHGAFLSTSPKKSNWKGECGTDRLTWSYMFINCGLDTPKRVEERALNTFPLNQMAKLSLCLLFLSTWV